MLLRTAGFKGAEGIGDAAYLLIGSVPVAASLRLCMAIASSPSCQHIGSNTVVMLELSSELTSPVKSNERSNTKLALINIGSKQVWPIDKISSWLGKMPGSMEEYNTSVKQVKWLSILVRKKL